MKQTDKITYMQIKEQYDFTSGEVKKVETQTDWKVGTEPNYIKLYLDCLLAFGSLSKSLNPILLEFLKYMSYASTANDSGGQVIYINAEMKRQVGKTANVKVDRVNQAITEFVKANIFKRIAVSTYQINPHLFGKGDWKDIKSIRACFDFNTGEVQAEVEKIDRSNFDPDATKSRS